MSKEIEKPSYFHPNRKSHNFAIYDIIDANLIGSRGKIKGVVYDLGCGEMPYKKWFLQYATEYVGVDWGGSIHELKANIISDLNEPLPINSESADTIVSISVMEHLREPQMFLNEAYRILKKDSVMLLQVPFMWWVHEAPYDYFRYTRYGLEYMYKKAGFTDVCITPQAGFWFMSTLKLNYQLMRLVRGPILIRRIVKIGLSIIFKFNQRFALWMDKYWKCEFETVGYFVIARKE